MSNSFTTWMKRMLLPMSIMIAISVACLAHKPSLAGEFEFRPSIAVSEEVTDNIYEDPANKHSEFITRVQPGFSSRYQAALMTWDLGYTFDYRNYARNSTSSQYYHDANLRGSITLVKDFMFLDISDIYHRVTTDVSRTAATETSLYLNQTDQNTAVISPYAIWRLSDKDVLTTRYRYTDIRYLNTVRSNDTAGSGSSTTDSGTVDSFEHAVLTDLNHEVSSKFSLSAGYGFAYFESQPTRYTKHDLSAGFRYEYAERSFIFGQFGNSWQKFTNGGSTSYLFWNAGVTHDFNFAVATLATRVQTAVDPLATSIKETSYSGRIEKTLQRGMLGLSASYTEYVNTETGSVNQQFLANGGDRQTLTCSGTGRYEVLQDLTANLTATFDRYWQQTQTTSDYPYRISAVAGLNYLLKDALTIGLTYTYAIYLMDLSTDALTNEINKAVVELRKVF